jgi:hypothetical protein
MAAWISVGRVRRERGDDGSGEVIVDVGVIWNDKY